jgi:hypothetical protein
LVAQDEDFGVSRRTVVGEQAEPADHRPQDQIEESQGREAAIIPDRLHQRTSRSQGEDEVVGTHKVEHPPIREGHEVTRPAGPQPHGHGQGCGWRRRTEPAVLLPKFAVERALFVTACGADRDPSGGRRMGMRMIKCLTTALALTPQA